MSKFIDPTESDIFERLKIISNFNPPLSDLEFATFFRIKSLGDDIAKSNDWPLAGWDAIVFELIRRHHWLPEDIEKMSIRHLCITLCDQLAFHKLNPWAEKQLDLHLQRRKARQ